MTGTRPPTTPSPCCAPRPAATPTTGDLSDLIGELSTRSDEFRGRWAAHDVQIHPTGLKLIHHPVVGDLDLAYESFPLAGDLSQSLLTYTAEPGSPTQDALTLLASWAASTTRTRCPTTIGPLPSHGNCGRPALTSLSAKVDPPLRCLLEADRCR